MMVGGGPRATKPNNDNDKIIALAPPAIKEITINQDGGRLVSRADTTGNGRASKRGEGGGERGQEG